MILLRHAKSRALLPAVFVKELHHRATYGVEKQVH
jgi:hypothetical protein